MTTRANRSAAGWRGWARRWRYGTSRAGSRANCAGGFESAGARGIIAGSNGFPGNVNEHFKNFGWTLAAGDFDGDGHDDLAIGAPFENGGGFGDIGAQTILYGSLFADGFETVNSALWSGHVP